MSRIIECVPNFSEGRDAEVIDAIAGAISSVPGVCVLNVDPGEAANRTVITFIGEPEAVVEGAFSGVKRAGELIDMTRHHGVHPRLGATDVLPLIPVEGVTLGECAMMARDLGRRIADELGIPVYCYEAAAFSPSRVNLAQVRSGEYEKLRERLRCDAPDFGGGEWSDVIARSGASIVGARDYLIAVNFNLDSQSVPLASEIACDVREKGRILRDENGEPVLDSQGRRSWVPGTLKGVKALGWYIEEYGIAQVTMNITDISATALHEAFEEVSRAAARRGARVTGTEIIGLVSRRCLIEAGEFYLARSREGGQGCPCDGDAVSEKELVDIAIKSMGLDDLCPFNPREKVIEYRMKALS